MDFRNIFKHMRHLIAIIILVIIVLSGGYLFYNHTQNSINVNIIKTDIKPVADRFPSFVNIQKSYWKAKVLTTAWLPAPGPTPYEMCGYIILKDDSFNSIYEGFKWQRVDPLTLKPTNKYILPGFSLEGYKKSEEWMYSEDFDEKYMSSKYFGGFCIEPKQKLIYFYIQQ